MIPRTNHLGLVALLLVILAVAGCAAVMPDAQSSEPTTVVDANIDSDRTPTAIPEPPPTSTTPPEAVATATDLPAPTATATPTTLPTQTPITKPRAQVVANDYGAAPEINTEVWLNTDQPLRLEDLRGQVVLVDFWTYG